MRKVMLVTKELAAKLPPLYANEGKKPEEIQVAFKIFNPYGAATWFITEGNLETGELFGLCDLGFGTPELGYVNLNELQGIRVRGMPLERDRYYSGTLAEAMKSVGYEWRSEEEMVTEALAANIASVIAAPGSEVLQ